jgi:hypothetical protein
LKKQQAPSTSPATQQKLAVAIRALSEQEEKPMLPAVMPTIVFI